MKLFKSRQPVSRHKKAGTGGLFLFHLRPRMRGISFDWDKPFDEEAYQKLIDDEGFISTKLWDADDINQYPVVATDIKDLENHLLPTFFEFNQKSQYYKNRFYLYQWLFLWGAFFIIVFASVSAIYTIPPGAAPVFDNVQAVQQFFSSLTAIIGATTAFFIALSYRGDPQEQWGQARFLGEGLRRQYYLYLSHLPPFDKPDRLNKLRETALNARLAEREKSSNQADDRLSAIILRPEHEARDIELLYRVYQQKRIQSQIAYYEQQNRINRLNTNFTLSVPALLITLASLVAVVSASGGSSWLTVISAVLPAFALLLVSFRQFYAWERQKKIYDDCLAGFDKLSLALNDIGQIDKNDFVQIYPQIVLETEKIINAEVSQLGLQAGVETQSQRKGMIEIEPTFGTPASQDQFKCDIFMIMPFAEPFQPIYKDNIVLVASKLRMTIKRGDDFFSEHAIMDEVWAGIYHSRMVITECTGRNANVYYELGIAHTLGKPAIMITQDIEDTPFDLRHLRIIVYQNTPEGLKTLCDELEEAIVLLQKSRILGLSLS
jgi:Protein of unknown function (DUF4231)/SMODS and SLOG-associating 2TM effector domain 1